MAPTNGFLYANDMEREQEFAAAQYFFVRHPELHKISRKIWPNLYKNLTPNEQKELCQQLGFDPKNPPKHSYFKPQEGLIVAFASGKQPEGLLGEGQYGRVKFAMDCHEHMYAIKIEKRKVVDAKEPCKNEAFIAQDVQLMKGPRIEISKDSTCKKFYSLLEYLGISLHKYIQQSSPVSFSNRLELARKLAWEVHQLHSGYLSMSQKQYAHHDLKPENIVLYHNTEPKLIDYGFAALLTEGVSKSGSVLYMPFSKKELIHRNYESIEKTLHKMTPEEQDLFALKRIFYLGDIKIYTKSVDLFSNEEFKQFPQALQDSIETFDVTKTLQRKNDSPLKLAILLWAFEHKQNPDALNNMTPKHLENLYQSLAMVEWLKQKGSSVRAINWQSLIDTLFSIKNEFEMMFINKQLCSLKEAIGHLNDYDLNDELEKILTSLQEIHFEITRARATMAQDRSKIALFDQEIQELWKLNNKQAILDKARTIYLQKEFDDLFHSLRELIDDKTSSALFLSTNHSVHKQKYLTFKHEVDEIVPCSQELEQKTNSQGRIDLTLLEDKLNQLKQLELSFEQAKNEITLWKRHAHIQLTCKIFRLVEQKTPFFSWSIQAQEQCLFDIKAHLLQQERADIFEDIHLARLINNYRIRNLLTSDEIRTIRQFIVEHDIPNMDIWQKPIGLSEQLFLFFLSCIQGQSIVNHSVSEENAQPMISASSTSLTLKSLEATASSRPVNRTYGEKTEGYDVLSISSTGDKKARRFLLFQDHESDKPTPGCTLESINQSL